jgi:hypothetical protein
MTSLLSKIKANQERNLELNKSRIKNETDIEYNEFKTVELPKNHVNPRLTMANDSLALEDRSYLESGSSSFLDNTELRRFDMYKKSEGDTSQVLLKDAEQEAEAIIENNTKADTPDLGTVEQGTIAGVECPIENVLHDYEPVNYIITLSCLSKQSFNDGGGPETVILKSGGKGVQGEGNLAYDYYVEGLSMRNSVAPNQQTASGGFFQIILNVTEPYGSSFVDALIQAAKSQGYKDHLKAVYNLRIEFKGNDSEGKATSNIPYSTRDIPVHIFSVEMNIDAGVSTYQCQLAPAAYTAQTDLYGTTQASVTCSGDTVGDILEDFMDNYTKEVSTLQNSTNQSVKPGKTDLFVLNRDDSMAEILKSKINYTENSSLVKNYTVSNLDPIRIKQGHQRVITVPKDTKINTFIDNIVKSSRFYRDQFEGNRPKTKELVTLKIETQLKVGEDNGNGRDQYTFIYIVRSQKYTSDLMDGSIDTSNLMNPVRTYNYIHTGANKDVLNFDIKYQFAYYLARPYGPDKGAESTDAQSGAEEGDNANDQTQQNAIETYAYEPLNQSSNEFIPGVNDSGGKIVNIFQQVIQNPAADLIVTNLEILGDPFWIPQKTVSNQSFANSFTSCVNTDTRGAVATDESQLLIQLNFKQPVDLDDKSGLFKNLQDSQGFSGFYRVYICEHRFEGGVYTTTLQMVRVKNQKKETRTDSNLTNDTIIKEKYIPGKSYGFGNYSGYNNAVIPEGTNGVITADDGFVGITDMTNVSSDNVNKLPVNTGFETPRNVISESPTGIVNPNYIGLPQPKIGVELLGDKPKYYTKEQYELVLEIGATPEKSRINPDGYQ